MSDDKRLMNQPRKDTAIENIIAYFLDERSVELTPHEEDLKDRYKAAFTFLIEEDSLIKPVKKLMKMYDVSQATAYNYLNTSELIFGSVKKFEKEAWRYIQIARKRRMIKRAKKAGNLEVEARLERDIDKLLDFDKDPEKFNPEKFKAMQIEIKVPKGTEKLLNRMFKKGVVDLNNVSAEDIDFEEVE